jgi:four helix bundle protein
MIKSFKDLKIWQRSMDLCENIYNLLESFPSPEKYGLVSQISRTAVSIPSNIAEGHERSGSKDFLRFLSIALGSLAELETQLLIAKRLKFLKEENESLFNEIYEIGKMINALNNKLKNNNNGFRELEPETWNPETKYA